MDEKILSLSLTDEWEEYRPREVNLDTLTIWLGHKNPYPTLLALTPDDPNFSSDLLHPRTARYDYKTDLKITEYPDEQTAQQSLESYIVTYQQTLNNITAALKNISPQLLPEYKKALINMGCSATKGDFFGESAVFSINQKNEKTCYAVRINDFILTGDIFNYSFLPPANTPIHSALCELTRRSHNLINCRCSYCKEHIPCSTIAKEGLVYPEKVENIMRQIFNAIKITYTTVKIKPGISDANLKDVIKSKYGTIVNVFKRNKAPQPVITSTNDGNHKCNSRHYTNEAIDLRGNDMPDDLMKKLADDLSQELGKDYDILAEFFPQDPERDHIHIEYDPK